MTAPRILILGGPGVGKTTLSHVLAKRIGLREELVRHTDDLVGVLEWSEASEEVARWIAEDGPWIIEGTAAVRGLRKAIAARPDVLPAEHVLYLTEPYEPLNEGQRRMTVGHETIWRGIADDVARLGCKIHTGRSLDL